MTSVTEPPFSELGLSAPVLAALARVGYEAPTPIQAQSIPPLLEGRDLLGTAQTGTGKTAAFALPLLSRLDTRNRRPQVLVLAPTRELAIQVAEAFQTYAGEMRGFHVLPIYGGQSMGVQLRQLSRGAQVIVGTPGRVMDHLRRGTLKLDALRTVVLDEADEMLRMGFIEDVQWILEQTPAERQVALFSATMPPAIRSVADTYLRSPVQIRIDSATSTVERIEQKYWVVSGTSKLEALTRILEVEDTDGVILFVRTKVASENLADRLEARGHAAAAINGDMTQAQREATIARLKRGAVDILVATDVAARGIDVTRISHVINYDIPSDTETYVHRIGRTGRAGRDGTAILFVAPRERRLLAAIERATRQKMSAMELPSKSEIDRKRAAVFKDNITEALESGKLRYFELLIEEYVQEHDATAHQVASALAWMLSERNPAPAVADEPMIPDAPATGGSRPDRAPRPPRSADGTRPGRSDAPKPRPRERAAPPAHRADRPQAGGEKPELETFRIAVGHEHKVKVGDIVGAIANEAELESRYIGRIRMFDDHSTIELPVGMPRELLQHLRKVRVRSHKLEMERLEDASAISATAAPPARATQEKQPRKRPAAKATKGAQEAKETKGTKAPNA